uniref:Large ribosomal subunit protein uL14m n=2 Tax=Ascaris suum TaxID=6253 RepID=F1LFG4_ASCSU
MLSSLSSALSRLSTAVPSLLYISRMSASGRWWPQPHYELSRHRSRPPCPGIHRRTRCIVVDNSALGKEANTSGKLAYCIHVYKQGKRKKHMPHATLGDKILVAIRGEMRKAYVVGAKIHVLHRKHGVPSTDTNNIVLLDEEGNPLGTRILSPIPGKLLERRDKMQFSKVLALANKFV